MGAKFGETEDFGIGMVTAQTDKLCDKLFTGEAGLDDVALSEVRHKAVAHKAISVLTSVFIDENISPRPWSKARAKP